jgi:hypothetical protein
VPVLYAGNQTLKSPSTYLQSSITSVYRSDKKDRLIVSNNPHKVEIKAIAVHLQGTNSVEQYHSAIAICLSCSVKLSEDATQSSRIFLTPTCLTSHSK